MTASQPIRSDLPRPRLPRTSFLGREAELSLLVARLREPGVRLVTITGRGGSGKTRLALETASRLAEEWPGGVAHVELAAIAGADASAAIAKVAAALHQRIPAGQAPEAALARHLRYEPVLLVVDDLDRVEGAVDLLLDLLDEAPDSRLLATANAPLRAPGERVVRLGPLPAPDETVLRPAEIAASPAVALFVARAGAVDARFVLDERNAVAVATLCRRLDGLPLGIELAASRVATLGPAAQITALERGLALELAPLDRPGGTPGSRIRTTLEWSHRLIGDRERHLLHRMSVFEGAASIEALIGVCGGPDLSEADVLDALTTLVDVHLVEPDDGPRDRRYRLLPLVRDFACEQLEQAGGREGAALAHARWYSAWAARGASPGLTTGVRRLARERDNLLAALRTWVERRDLEQALGLVARLGPLWNSQGMFAAHRQLVDDLLADPGTTSVPPGVLAEPVLWWAMITTDQVDSLARRDEIAARFAQGLDLARASGSADLLQFALFAQVRPRLFARDLVGAIAAMSEGMALAQTAGSVHWQATFEMQGAMLRQQGGDIAGAAALGRVALGHALALDDTAILAGLTLMFLMLRLHGEELPPDLPSSEVIRARAAAEGDLVAEAWMVTNAAWWRLTDGDVAGACGLIIDAIRIARRSGVWHSGAICLVLTVRLLAARGRPGDDAVAARLHGAVTPRMQALEAGLTAKPSAVYRDVVAGIHDRLGEEVYARQVAEGVVTPWDDLLGEALAIVEAQHESLLAARPVRRGSSPSTVVVVAPGSLRARERHRAPSYPGPERLTPRELDVLRLLASGDSNPEIAVALGLSPKTVMHHSVSIYGKLGVRGRAEATAWAHRNGIMGDDELVPAEPGRRG